MSATHAGPRPGTHGRPQAADRSLLRSVGLPSEHGGWGLTLEPVVLGLAVAPSVAGLALGLAAFLTFLVRTPLKLAVVDVRRGRWLPRSKVAALLAAVEVAAIAGLIAVALWRGSNRWWEAVAIALPLGAVEFAYDVRSRSRRLVPELCGAVAIAGVAAAIVLADGRSWAVAAALWLVLAGRIVGSIPFVRAQIARLRHRPVAAGVVRAVQAIAVLVAAAGLIAHRGVIVAVALVVGAGWWHSRSLTLPVPPPKVMGMREMFYGLAVVVAAAAGVWITS